RAAASGDLLGEYINAGVVEGRGGYDPNGGPANSLQGIAVLYKEGNKMHARVQKIRIHRRWRRFLLLRSLRRDDGGVQLVELAIVLPLFMILFGATAEFGRYFYEYSTLAKATRVCTRYLTNAAINTA